MTLWPDSGLGIIILANTFPTGVPEGLTDTFADLVFDGAVAQDHFAPWNKLYDGLFAPYIEAQAASYGTPPDPPSPPLADAAYAGTYANAYAGDAVVAAEGDGLVLLLGPDGARRLPLTHYDRDLFLYYPDPEMPATPTPLQFTLGPDGRASSVQVGSFDGNGWAMMARKP